MIDFEELPEIDEKIDLNFKAQKIEIAESVFKKGKTEYKVLESCFLKK